MMQLLTPRPLIVSMLNNQAVNNIERKQYAQANKSLDRALTVAEGGEFVKAESQEKVTTTAPTSARRDRNISPILTKELSQSILSRRSIELSDAPKTTSKHRAEYDEGMDCFQKPLRLSADTSSRCFEGTILCNLARVHHNLRQYGKALAWYKRSLRTLENWPYCDETLILAILFGIGQMQYIRGDHSESLRTYTAGLNFVRSAFGEESLEVAACLNCIGVLHSIMPKGDSEKALESLLTSIRFRKQILGEDHIDVGTTWNNVGRIYFQQGQYEQAMDSYIHALRIRRKERGDSVDVAATIFNIGQAFHQQGELDQALRHYQEFLRLAKQHLGNFHRDICVASTCIGQVLHEKKHFKEALTAFHHALKIGRIALGTVHAEIAITWNKLGNLYFEMGDLDSALKAYHNCLKVELTVLEPGNPNVCVSYTNIAEIYMKQSEYDCALQNYEKVLLLQRRHSFDPSDIANTLSSIGYIRHQKGECTSAPLKSALKQTNGNQQGRRTTSASDRVIIKTQSLSDVEDSRAIVPGSITHSMVHALTIGVVCGIAAWIYYTAIWWLLNYVWHTLPLQIWGMVLGQEENSSVIEQHGWYMLWIPIVVLTMAFFAGLMMTFVGEPGDLPYTIKSVHEKAYVAMDHVLPLVAASQFSIVGGGSLSPEAPLVAICAALGGFISRTIFQTTSRNLIRKHRLMGMSGALAAFFGVPLAGSLFALEVNSRCGNEYFEHAIEAILSGEICLAVFRGLARLPIEPIWRITFTADKFTLESFLEIIYGTVLGLVGAIVAWVFSRFHKEVIALFRRLHLLENTHASILRAIFCAVVVVFLGVLTPHTTFWGEFEFQTIASLDSASTLDRIIWRSSGLVGFEMNSFWTYLIVGITKLISISFSVAGGYSGGYICPAFAAASALGHAISFVCPFIPVQLCVFCMVAALNVALTRTVIATTLILCFLSGEQNAKSSILVASLVSMFVTECLPIISSQKAQSDLHESIFRGYDFEADEDYEGSTGSSSGEEVDDKSPPRGVHWAE